MSFTLEQVIFVLLAALAIVAAVGMLTSRSAVHAALFLVVNFLCVALFYLMLNAPFLAMIQVTVYAGAIMVLFMFVIMLLGAERLGVPSSRFGWVTPFAVLFGVALLILAGAAVANGNIAELKPLPHNPELRVVHAVAGAPTVDIYLNDTKALETVGFEKATHFGTVLPGEYEVKLFPTCTETDTSKCVDPITSKAKPVFTTTVNLAPETVTTYVLTGTAAAPKLVTLPTDLAPASNDNVLRLQVVNGLLSDTVSLFRIDPTRSMSDAEKAKLPANLSGEYLVENLAPGAFTPKALELNKGDYDLLWLRGNERFAPVPAFRTQAKTTELLVLTQETNEAAKTGNPVVVHVDPERLDETFGSPQAMGYTMLSTFLLPFEVVSLLLLAALVGAIILTREDVVRRVRQRVKVSGTASRINRAIADQQTGQASSAESSAD